VGWCQCLLLLLLLLGANSDLSVLNAPYDLSVGLHIKHSWIQLSWFSNSSAINKYITNWFQVPL
jgi:hypothetical protein